MKSDLYLMTVSAACTFGVPALIWVALWNGLSLDNRDLAALCGAVLLLSWPFVPLSGIALLTYVDEKKRGI